MKLHYKAYGKHGSSVLILHGLFGMLDNWQTFARALADGYRVYTVDLRNHGRSPHDPQFDYPTLAKDMIDFIHQHHLEDVVIMGHSLGGKVAMETTLRYPDLANKLIVVDMAPRAYTAGHDAIIEALMSVPISSLRTRKEVEKMLLAKLNDTGVVLFLMKNVGRKEDGSLFWRMNLPVLAEKYAETTKAIERDRTFERPALFVRGGQSKYITDSDWKDIVALFPRARLETIAKAGHWVHADAMEELLALVRDFLTTTN